MPNHKYQIAVEAIDRFSAPFKAVSKASQKVTGEIREQRAELKQLNAAQRNLGNYDKLQTKLEATGAKLESAKLKMAGFKAEIKATAKPTKKLTEQYKKAAATVEVLKDEHREQSAQLDKLGRKLNDTGVDTGRLADEQKRLERSTESANNALKAQQARLKGVREAQGRIEANRSARANLRGKMMGVAAAGYVASRPLGAAIDFDSSMAGVRKAVNDATPEQMKELRKRILLEAPDLGVSSSGMADIVAELGRNGIQFDQLFDYAEIAAKMSVAFDVTAGEASLAMMKWRNTMGDLSLDQLKDLADSVNYLGDNASTTAKDISRVLVDHGGTLKAAGLSNDQAAGLAGAVLSASSDKSLAGTASKNLVLALTAGDTATLRQKAAFDRIGIDPVELAQRMQEDAAATAEEVLLSIKELDPTEQLSTARIIFNKEGLGAIMALLGNVDKFRDAVKYAQDKKASKDSMEREFIIQSQTSRRQIEKFNNSMTVLGVSLTTTLLPGINAVLEPVSKIALALSGLAMEHEGVTKAVVGTATVLGGLAAATLTARYAYLGVSQVFNRFRLGKAKLDAATGGTARAAPRAAAALNRVNAALNRMGYQSVPVTGDAGGGKVKRKKKPLKTAGKFGVTGAVIASASMVPAMLNAGDAKEAGAAAGGMAGGIGGSLGGAKLGAMAGSFLGPIGAAVGGVAGTILGGLYGADGGEWLGKTIGGWFSDDEPKLPEPAKISEEVLASQDRLPPPDKAAQSVTNTNDNRKLVFSPTINIPPSTGDAEADKRLAKMVLDNLKSELIPVMGGSGLDVRLDATLSDRAAS